MYKLIINKEYNHFTSAHFIVFNEKDREMLHGHNYHVRVEVSSDVIVNGKIVDVNAIKPLIKKICDDLDHRFLLPLQNKYIAINETKDSIEIIHNFQKFIFPSNDVLKLNVENSTMEILAEYICSKLLKNITIKHITGITVRVEETKGQSAEYSKYLLGD